MSDVIHALPEFTESPQVVLVPLDGGINFHVPSIINYGSYVDPDNIRRFWISSKDLALITLPEGKRFAIYANIVKLIDWELYETKIDSEIITLTFIPHEAHGELYK